MYIVFRQGIPHINNLYKERVHSTCSNLLWQLFQNSSYVSGVSICIFVALYLCNFVTLYVRMFVARANKVEGTMS